MRVPILPEIRRCVRAMVLVLICTLPLSAARASIDGVTGPVFNLTATSGYIQTADGAAVLMWSFAGASGLMQYPGPTLIVQEGDVVTVNLTNALSEPVSIVFPGQIGVAATSATATPGPLGLEAPPGGTIQYTFTASEPGTYAYQSGANAALQIEMGLVGALIVRPLGAPNQAYRHANTAFEQEYLFLLSEIDPAIHAQVERGDAAGVDMTARRAQYWLINGRTGVDTLLPSGLPWMPSQPYGALARTHPGDRVLARFIGAGLDSHPFHPHGQNVRIIGRDGRMRSTDPVLAGANAGQSVYTLDVAPGQTYDTIWKWEAHAIGWDVFGHAAGDACLPEEICDPLDPDYDHGKAVPVALPEQQFLSYGGFYSGNPHLGAGGTLPPGQGGFNPSGAYWFIWHSHAEAELVNDNIFPGGMLTMMLVEAPGTPIP